MAAALADGKVGVAAQSPQVADIPYVAHEAVAPRHLPRIAGDDGALWIVQRTQTQCLSHGAQGFGIELRVTGRMHDSDGDDFALGIDLGLDLDLAPDGCFVVRILSSADLILDAAAGVHVEQPARLGFFGRGLHISRKLTQGELSARG